MNKRGNFRWVICGLLFFSVAISYIDRQIIGLLKQPLSKELGWGENDYATIAAAFQVAYAFGYLFGGRAMDWLGVKLGLPLSVFLWSVACAAHGFVRSVVGFATARVGLGLAEGGNFPGAIKTVAEWFPVRERALATGVFNVGTNVGAIVCPLVVPWMATAWGWQMTFFITGALGILWIVVWALVYEVPEKHPRLSESERNYIQADEPRVITQQAAIPWLTLLKRPAVWAYLIAGMLAGPVWPFYLFFLPDFLQKRYHLSLTDLGLPVAIFYLIASFGGVAGGWLAAKLIGRGWSINAARKISLLACAVSVVPLFLAPYVPNLWLTVIIVGIAGSAHQGWSANLFSFVSDTMPKEAVGAVVGMGGFVAFITGAVVAKVVGYVLEATGSYVWVFAGASLTYVISLTALHLLVPRIEQPARASS
ncbi:MAG TPA: MFS transporter [Verrucomicrobiae bacterium]|nr:MFS transporter [Verrucomicrobiae bacterium]